MIDEEKLKTLLPDITDVNNIHYEKLNDEMLMINKCEDCENHFFPPANHCPKCLSNHIQWVETSGEGSLYSWVEYHYAYHEAFKERLPYLVGIIELNEGCRIIANLVECKEENLKIGMPLRAVFIKGITGSKIVAFKP